MRLVLALALLAASPALAQEGEAPARPDRRTFQPPEGCTAFLTIQMAACTVSSGSIEAPRASSCHPVVRIPAGPPITPMTPT